MTRYTRLRLSRNHFSFHRQLPLHRSRCIHIFNKAHFTAASTQRHEDIKATEPPKAAQSPTWLDFLLESPPAPWVDRRVHFSNKDTSQEFKEWISARSFSDEDGKMLFRLKEHIMNGGHPDFPRLLKEKDSDGTSTNTKCLKHMTSDYYTSIDSECLKWIKKQRKLYRNRTIHPWLQWKLEQMNVTLEWFVFHISSLIVNE